MAIARMNRRWRGLTLLEATLFLGIAGVVIASAATLHHNISEEGSRRAQVQETAPAEGEGREAAVGAGAGIRDTAYDAANSVDY